jgi:hypothetical protein
MVIRSTETQPLITETNLVEYFQSSVDDALANQNIEVEPQTAHYLVNILSFFSRTENLYHRDADGYHLKPLALMYAEAAEEPSPDLRSQALQRLGDISLFICGVFSDSLTRKAVDVDYYIAMGGGAYAYLSDDVHASRLRILCDIFSELSTKFTDCVDVLAEVSERDGFNSNKDVLRTYEVWLRSGSRRALKQLQAQGIEPISASMSRGHH